MPELSPILSSQTTTPTTSSLQITPERLRELLSYDPDTGVFTWKVNKGREKQGNVAGCKSSHGYITIRIDSKIGYAHRIAWMYVHGKLPEYQIDHINGVRDDNRLVNLRDTTQAVNAQNLLRARSDNQIGVLGVCLDNDSKKFRANITISGKAKSLGSFNSAEEAHQAYLSAKRKLHAGCTL